MIYLKIKVSAGETRPVNLFFIELIISLLFFSFSGAVVLRVFAYADSKARLGSTLENATLCAQSIAEAYSSDGDIGAALSAVFGEEYTEYTDGGELPLDNKCSVCESGTVRLSYSEYITDYAAGELRAVTLCFSVSGEELYSLTCSAYVPGGGAADE